MSTVWADGFDQYGVIPYQVNPTFDALPPAYSVVPYQGGFAYLPDSTVDRRLYYVTEQIAGHPILVLNLSPLGFSTDTIFVGMRFLYDTAPGVTATILKMESLTGVEIRLNLTDASTITATWSSGATDTFTGSFPPNATIDLEVSFTSSTGALTLYVNGASLGTKTHAPAWTDTIYLIGLLGSGTPGGKWYMRDLVVRDTTGTKNNTFPIGRRAVLTIYPDSDDRSVQDFSPTPSQPDGQNFANLRKGTPDDTTYLAAGAAGDKYECGFGSPPDTTLTVEDIIIVHRGGVGHPGATAVKAKCTLIGAGDGEIAGTEHTMDNSTFTFFYDNISQNPDGGNTPPALLDSLRVRVERTQ